MRGCAQIVYVIDDDPSVRAALADLLVSVNLEGRCYAAPAEFLAGNFPPVPSCLVLDVRVPGMNGLELHLLMRRRAMLMPVIFITGHGDIAMSVEAMKNGAIEFLAKPFRDHDLLSAIQRGLELDRRRLQDQAALQALRTRWQSLAPGEQSVARLVVDGLLNKQIATRLGLSEVAVKVRRGHAMRKLQAHSLADLVRLLAQLDSAS
ncbi:MAG: response regulator transcription factor [Gammaproteobacteria bacterium]|nr:response regulator transcription factor [Gammaproteobacteria bacterium]